MKAGVKVEAKAGAGAGPGAGAGAEEELELELELELGGGAGVDSESEGLLKKFNPRLGLGGRRWAGPVRCCCSLLGPRVRGGPGALSSSSSPCGGAGGA